MYKRCKLDRIEWSIHIKSVLQYRLRALLLLVALAAALLTWMSHQRRAFVAQRASADVLTRSYGALVAPMPTWSPLSRPIHLFKGAETVVIGARDHHSWRPQYQVFVDRRASRCLEPLKTLVNLEINGTLLNDADLQVFDGHATLEYLVLVSGEFFARCELPALQRLSIRRCPVESFEGLVHCTRLEELSLSHISLDFDLLNCIAQLESIRALDLSYMEISDDGLRRVPTRSQIQKLSLIGSSVSTSVVSWLQSFRQLRVLILSRSDICKDFQGLHQLPELAELRLDYTNVSDQDIAEISSLPRLRRLDINGTQATDQGVRAALAHPEIEIVVVSESQLVSDELRRDERVWIIDER